MPDTTSVLSLPLIQPSQAQKHITHNEALAVLDAVVQLAVADRNRSAPPASPAEGDRHLIAAAPTGAWAGQAGRIACFSNGAWVFYQPNPGWRLWVAAESLLLVWNGSQWTGLLGNEISIDRLGVSATADATNRLSVNSPAVLLNHAGAGMEATINKAASTDDASLAFKQGFSARALVGLLGTEDFRIKVSPDGSAYFDAIEVDRQSGGVSAHAFLRLMARPADPAAPVDGQIWHHSASGEVRIRSAGQTVTIRDALADGDKGDVTVSGGGTVWQVNPSLRYGMALAMADNIFFN